MDFPDGCRIFLRPSPELVGKPDGYPRKLLIFQPAVEISYSLPPGKI
ncbi:MAG: hypothetical protein WBJ32_02580 [Bacillota bacterium]|jgi:hypothetical protein